MLQTDRQTDRQRQTDRHTHTLLCLLQVTAKAVANRNAETDDELTITADEVLLVFPDDSSAPEGWIVAERAGKRGRVPKDCLEFN